MARTYTDIKQEMGERFMADEYMQARYGFTPDASFDATFSKVSVENIFFSAAAFGIWALEKLFDYHSSEVAGLMERQKAHTERWYVSKAKAYMPGYELVEDTDYYDTSAMTDDEINAARIIRYAVAVEKAGQIYIKVATDANGERSPLVAETLAGFIGYMKEVKDAGVILEYINEPAEHFRLTMTVYYNPMVLTSTGDSQTGGTPVHDAIREFIRDLPFNGEYRNLSLVDRLQLVEGVVIPELKAAETSRDGLNWETIDAKATPHSGYYKIYDENTDLRLTFVPYETVSD